MAQRPSPEQRIAGALRTILQGVPSGSALAETPYLQCVLTFLEHFLPQILSELYVYWKSESLDGLYLSEARKIGPNKAELRGVCILISDQAITPFHLKMQVSPFRDEIDWMECRLGKRGDGKGGMERAAWSRRNGHSYKFLRDSLKSIDWTYTVTCGEERDQAS